MSKIGVHVKTGSRNGYGLVCDAKPATVFSVGEGGALVEAKEKSDGYTWTFYRDIKYYGDNPNLNQMTAAQASDRAKELYPLLKEQWQKNPADAYAVLNEPAANDTEKIPVYNAYEKTMMELAEQDGFQLVVCNLFSGTPDDGSVAGNPPNGGMETWKRLYGDHIARAFEGNHFYGRHCYGFPDLFPLDFNSDRPLREAYWLESEGIIGGIVVTELGLNGGMVSVSTERLLYQMAQWDAWLRNDPIGNKFIAGGCWWTYGDWYNANIQGHSNHISNYIYNNQTDRWEWPEDEGTDQPGSLEQYLWAKSVDIQKDCGIRLNEESALEKAIRADGLIPVISESTESPPDDPNSYVIRAGEDLEHSKPRKVYVYQPGKEVWSFMDPGTVVVPPEPEFALEKWPADSYEITQQFGANPANYAKYGLPGHNGIDIKAPWNAPFYAPADGKVVWASDRQPSDPDKVSDYGWHVRIDHGTGHTSILAHCAPDLSVEVGEHILAGHTVGRSGNTGNSSGPHLHYELRKCPGDPGWPWCIVDPWPYLKPLYQPPATGVDMRPYFLPVAAGYGPFFVLQHKDGRTENVQHQVTGNEVWVVKNNHYEHLRIHNGHVERREDTSPDPVTSPADLYLLDDGYGWSRWCPQVWRPGDVFWREPTVKWMDKYCNIVRVEKSGSWLKFEQWIDTWTSPASAAAPSGIVLKDVVVLGWYFDLGGQAVERYWIAKNIGYPVQWKNSAGAHSWISELPQGRDPLSREVIHCL